MEEKVPIAPYDHVMVQTEEDKIKVDKIKYKSLELIRDPDFHPELASQCWAEIRSLPRLFKKSFNGDIKVGDKAFIHYNALDTDSYIFTDYGKFYRVHVEDIICVVREGVICPVGDWLICKPLYGENVVEREIEGVKTLVEEINGLITNHNPDHDQQKCEIAFSNVPELKAGEVVCFEEDADFENAHNKINEIKYLYIKKQDIICRIL